jgi:phosphoglucomutase
MLTRCGGMELNMQCNNIMEQYKLWRDNVKEEDLANELISIDGNQDEIAERFCMDLEFGTAGLRGIIGAGTNRMNIYTVCRATQGFCDYLNMNYKNPKVAIAYDSRIKSDVFAKQTASVFAANNILVYIFKELQPTPMLSFAVRYLKCSGGVVITASHNPSKYNGYKAYNHSGYQLTVDASLEVFNLTKDIDVFNSVKKIDFDEAIKSEKIKYIDGDVVEKFLQEVLLLQQNAGICKKAELSVVYTPLNGAGNIPVREIFKRVGVKKVYVVKQQENPDGNFTTCPYPNPEKKEAMELALLEADKVKPDIVIATDPDSDRVSISVTDDDKCRLFTGNEIGALLVDYICSQRQKNNTMPNNPVIIKSIVTSPLIDIIAKNYGATVINVLTGFKYIGEQVTMLEDKGEENRFLLGLEESFGYLIGTHARDKDAVSAAMLLCEIAAYYKLKNMTVCDALRELFKKYGTYVNMVKGFTFEGLQGMDTMQSILESLRENPPLEFGGLKVINVADYQTSIKKYSDGKAEEIKLPKSNVLEYNLLNNAQIIIRPSGTEPLIKAYFTVCCDDEIESQKSIQNLCFDVNKLLSKK